MIKLVNTKTLRRYYKLWYQKWSSYYQMILDIIAMNLRNIQFIQFSIRNCIMIAHSVPNTIDMYTNKFSLLGFKNKDLVMIHTLFFSPRRGLLIYSKNKSYILVSMRYIWKLDMYDVILVFEIVVKWIEHTVRTKILKNITNIQNHHKKKFRVTSGPYTEGNGSMIWFNIE